MQSVTKGDIIIAAIVFVLIAIFGGGFWAAVSAFALSPMGIAMLLVFVGVIVAVIFNR